VGSGTGHRAHPQRPLLVRSPALDKLRFRVVTNPTARLTAYTNGEGQVFLPTPAQLLDAAQDPRRSQDTRLLNWTNVRSPYLGIAWQCGDRAGKPSVFKDKRTRRAMTHLIDRALMNREIYRGVGTVISQPCNPESVQFDPRLEPWPCSTERATALLAEAGWKRRTENGPLVNGAGEEFRFAVTLPEMGEIDDQIARYLADRCAAVGIVCTADVVDRTAHAAKARAHDFDAILWAWFPRDPETDLSEIFHSRAIEGGNNFNQWSCPEADALLDKGPTDAGPDSAGGRVATVPPRLP
jgi:peptide/nickel transport system substrate-binding protein